MTATYVTGAQTTTTVLSNQLAIDIGKRISLLEPDVQILTVFSRAAETETAIATKFKWVEDEAKARFDTTSATATSSATLIGVTHGTYYQQWDQVLNTRTGEQFRVDAVVANELSVTRAIGSTGTAMLEGDELFIIGTAQPENDTSKVARSKTPSLVENNTQIFRTPFEISDTGMNVGYMVMPKEWDRLQQNAGIEHAKDIELSLLTGHKSATNPGSTEDRTTGGVLSFITSNQTDAGGTLSEAEFNAFMLQVMRYGSSSKLAIASGVAGARAEQVPRQQADHQERRNDLRDERDALHVALRVAQPRLPPPARRPEVRRLHDRRGHEGGRLPAPDEPRHENPAEPAAQRSGRPQGRAADRVRSALRPAADPRLDLRDHRLSPALPRSTRRTGPPRGLCPLLRASCGAIDRRSPRVLSNA